MIVAWRSFTVGAEILVVTNDTLITDAPYVRLVLICVLAQGTVTVYAKMPDGSAPGNGERVIDSCESMLRMYILSTLKAF